MYLSECTGQKRIVVYKQKRQFYLKNEKSLVRSRNWWGCLNRQSHWSRWAAQSLQPEREKTWCLVSFKKTTQYLCPFASFYERLSIKEGGKEAKGDNKKNGVYSHSVHKCFELICEEEDTKLRKSMSNYRRLLLEKKEEIKYRWSKRSSTLCAVWLCIWATTFMNLSFMTLSQ